MTNLTRRRFIQSTGQGILASSAVFSLAKDSKAAPSERIRHAVIGMGGQGRRHAKTFASFPDCDVVAVCDVDPERRDKAVAELPDTQKVAKVKDFREILDNPEIDTVSIATPDHWHTSIALAALIAGKHVYVEKPCSHNVNEGVLLAQAAKKYGKCVQHGTQSRSGEGIKDAIRFLQEGNLGKVRMAKAINHQLRGPIGRAPESSPPPGVNYDLWLGPAPVHPFTEDRWHYNWHWFWDYGTGDIGNDGIHQVDQARWGLGVGLPKAVTASGGQLFYDDDHQTPDTQVVTFEYEDKYLLYEMRLWTDYAMEGHDNGTIFYGDKGTVEFGRDGCFASLIGEPKKKIGDGQDFDGNIRNFVDCVKADDPTGLNAPISEGAISASLCHLGNVATRLGRRLYFDETTMSCTGDEEANRMLKREYRGGYELPDQG
jgi:predicted dehydrogenase